MEKLNKHKKTPNEFRCSGCGKLLARSDQKNVAIKCIRCGVLNSLFKGIAYQIVITNNDGVILYANALVEKITGYRLHEVLGKKLSLWGGKMSRGFYRNMRNAIKTKKSRF